MSKNASKDLLDALLAVSAPTVVPKGFYTVAQLVERTGMSRPTVESRLKKMNAEKQTFKIRWGSKCAPIAHYRLP